MADTAGFPLPFWLSCIAFLGGLLHAWTYRRQAWGLPAMGVLATVAAWYVGDALYNDYEVYVAFIGPVALSSAWWQVLLFAVVFCLLAPLMHRWINGSLLERDSRVMAFFETRRLEHPLIQRRITRASMALFIVWAGLMTVALVRVNGDAAGLFAPYLGHKAHPWGRDRIGGGFDALISLASYLQIFLAAGAGIVAAISRDAKVRGIALLICFLTFPTYIFDRTRNTMLATVLPGLLAWVFFRLRGGMIMKGAVLAATFFAAEAWFSFVMANRSEASIAVVVAHEEARQEREGRHEGLNMFGELAWINDFIDKGTYVPNGGRRYFAELVNPIPRTLWKDKPLIGIDYAIARGQEGGRDESAGVFATISTGMIGQGVVNFGKLFGPAAAALLMAGWTALLARQDLKGDDPGRLLLYACGMVLTFNMGRDITLLVVYPFLFGLILLKGWRYLTRDEPDMLEAAERRHPQPGHRRRQALRRTLRRPAVKRM